MAAMREEASKNEEEQKRLDAESNKKAKESLKEAERLLEEERRQSFLRLAEQNKELKAQISDLESRTKKDLAAMEER